jgi:hypothetical protein
VIYVNGDSHSAGADIIPGVCFAQDDPRYLAYGRRAHPEAVLQTYGHRIAQSMNQGFFCEAESGSSNDRILRTTKQYIENTKDKNTIGFIIVGWTSWEREEWKHGEDYLQVTASGTDSVPESMEEEYKEWVIKQTMQELKRKEQLWHERIWDFHSELKKQNIRHLFFNTMNSFTNCDKDWGVNFIPIPFCEWAAKQGFRTVENGNHYGADAHRAWGKYLTELICKHYLARGENIGEQLTTAEKRSIITQVKQEFKGLKN